MENEADRKSKTKLVIAGNGDSCVFTDGGRRGYRSSIKQKKEGPTVSSTFQNATFPGFPGWWERWKC